MNKEKYAQEIRSLLTMHLILTPIYIKRVLQDKTQNERELLNHVAGTRILVGWLDGLENDKDFEECNTETHIKSVITVGTNYLNLVKSELSSNSLTGNYCYLCNFKNNNPIKVTNYFDLISENIETFNHEILNEIYRFEIESINKIRKSSFYVTNNSSYLNH